MYSYHSVCVNGHIAMCRTYNRKFVCYNSGRQPHPIAHTKIHKNMQKLYLRQFVVFYIYLMCSIHDYAGSWTSSIISMLRRQPNPPALPPHLPTASPYRERDAYPKMAVRSLIKFHLEIIANAK